MDLGTIIKAPTQDKEWLTKCGIMGLICLIPIAGVLNLMGWMKATYANAKAGDNTLPVAGLSYIGSGWELFLAILPSFLVVMGLGIVVGIVSAVLKIAAVSMLLSLIVQLISLVNSIVIMPTMTYRHVVEKKGFSDAFDMADVKRVMSGKMFGIFILTYFVANLIGGLGIIVCCIGMFLTLPLAFAIHAHALKAFEDVNGLRSHSAPGL